MVRKEAGQLMEGLVDTVLYLEDNEGQLVEFGSGRIWASQDLN